MISRSRWRVGLVVVLTCFVVLQLAVLMAVPTEEGVRDWHAPLVRQDWMAWTFPTATFFLAIALLISLMIVWEHAAPGGNPRVGILRFETTRGDRLFLSLLGSAFIHLAWLGLVDLSLWWALALSLVYAIGVSRYV